MTRKNFTDAIKTYLDQTTVISEVNLYSLSTRVMYMCLFKDVSVSRNKLDCNSLEQVEVLEDLAAAYIVVNCIHPVEAVALAHQRLSKSDVQTSNIKSLIDMSKKAALVDTLQDTSTDDITDTIVYKQHISLINSVHACLNIQY